MEFGHYLSSDIKKFVKGSTSARAAFKHSQEMHNGFSVRQIKRLRFQDTWYKILRSFSWKHKFYARKHLHQSIKFSAEILHFYTQNSPPSRPAL